jgi:S-formylglutathione hydrolase FrmB
VAVRTDFYGPGTHNWPYWQRELRRALPLLLRGM